MKIDIHFISKLHSSQNLKEWMVEWNTNGVGSLDSNSKNNNS